MGRVPYNAAAQDAFTQIGVPPSSEQAKEVHECLRKMVFAKFPHEFTTQNMSEIEATPMVRRFLEHEGANFFNHTDVLFLNTVSLQSNYSGLHYLIKRMISVAVQEHQRHDRRTLRPASSPNPGSYSSTNLYPSATEYADYDYDSFQVHFGVLSEDLETFFAWENDKFPKLDASFVNGLFRFVEECYAMEKSSLTTLKVTVFNADGHLRGPPPEIFIQRSDLKSHILLERFALQTADGWKNSEGVLQLAFIPSRRELLVTKTSGPIATKKRTFHQMVEGGVQ